MANDLVAGSQAEPFFTPSATTVPWGSNPINVHVPVYHPISGLNFPDTANYLRTPVNLDHGLVPSSMPFSVFDLHGQNMAANATGRLRAFFEPITQVFHSPRKGK